MRILLCKETGIDHGHFFGLSHDEYLEIHLTHVIDLFWFYLIEYFTGEFWQSHFTGFMLFYDYDAYKSTKP